MGEDAKELFTQIILRNIIMVIETGLGTPADMQGRVNVGLGPFHDLAQLIPVVHIGKVQIFYRSSGNDHTVILPVFDLIKGSIEGREVAGICILRYMAEGVQQFYLDLKRRVGELTQQLGLSHDLSGHQI